MLKSSKAIIAAAFSLFLIFSAVPSLADCACVIISGQKKYNSSSLCSQNCIDPTKGSVDGYTASVAHGCQPGSTYTTISGGDGNQTLSLNYICYQYRELTTSDSSKYQALSNYCASHSGKTRGCSVSSASSNSNSVPDAAVGSLSNPLGSGSTIDTPQKFVGRIIDILFGFVGTLALVMLIYGGLTWMTANGDEAKIRKARGIVVWAGAGLAAIFMSYAVVYFLIINVK